MSTRRNFITWIPLIAAGGTGSTLAQPVALDPKDSQATALGYQTDATKVDKAKYPKYAAGQHCGACQLYQGKAGAANGPCPIFQNKLVAATGWCSAFVKKP
ncbi:high-potential iron-sulfur protein [Aquabacterium sp.]|uniref:high-potential iron-sulfur protein n=1 Tax=Aquabacterium sp. TaxID=1872578 RepID=UPI00378414D4